MENFNPSIPSSYLNNSYGHEFHENFTETFERSDPQQSKTQFEVPLHGSLSSLFDDGGITNNMEDSQWNQSDNTGYFLSNYTNCFENHPTTQFHSNKNYMTDNITQQYSFPSEPIHFASNNSTHQLNQQPLPMIQNINDNVTSTVPENVVNQYSCVEDDGCKVYSSATGLNNHIKKKYSRPALYHCDECPTTFKTTQQRTLHKIKEHDGRKYRAARYKATAKETANFEKTVKTNESRLNKCLSCDDTFNHKADLVRHMRNRHTGNSIFPCSKCSKVFFTYDMYNEHLSLHDDSIPKHTCNDCGKEFISKRKLKEHSIIHKERIMFKCEMCSKIFVRSQTLQYHRITCKAAFQCSKCVDSFMTAEALDKHKSFHETDTHTCIKCNKVFPTLSALTNHEKRHSLRMNYTCQICKESVSTRAKFQKHIKDHLESNLKCSVCNEEFQSLVKYGYHKAEMHGLMRPYDCLLCSDQFCTRHELFMHLHNHTDIKTGSYTCDLCGIKFSIKATYEQHKKSHTKDSEKANSSENVEKVNETVQLNSDDFMNIPHTTSKSSKCHEIICKTEGCAMTFITQKELKKHKTIHQLATYNCPKCKKVYHSRTVYETHVRLCTPDCEDILLVADEDIDSGLVECPTCSQLFENNKVLKFHGKFCNNDNDSEKQENHEIEEIYLKTEVEDDF